MKNRKRLIIIIVWTATMLASFYIGKAVESFRAGFEPVTVGNTILSGDYKNSIWIKKYSRDFRGNNPIIYLTTDKSRESPNPQEDIIFHDSESVFYRVNQDTLHIYSRINYEVKPNPFNGFYINVHELDNPRYNQLYDEFHSNLKTTEWMK